MPASRLSHTTHLLRLLIGAAVVFPLALFTYAGIVNYRNLNDMAAERLDRTLDVLQEHALRVFQTVDRTIGEAGEILRDLSDEEIRAQEAELHRRLRQTQQALPQIEAIWAFDRNGRALVSSTVNPVPPSLVNADRDYFRAHVDRDVGSYIGDIITARVGGGSFFVVSRRRSSPDGRFNGVIALTVPPASLQSFYAKVGEGRVLSAGLIRPDGTFLARFPAGRGEVARLGANNRFQPAIAANPERGVYLAVSQIDGIERRISYRRIPNYDVYVQAGFATDAVWSEWRRTMLGHLIFGLPATILLVALTFLALRRTREVQAEVQRREMAEAALKQAQRLEAVGQLTGGVAHDFNNLLMVVNGNVERLRRDLTDPRHKRALDSIDKAARRGASLTRQLLTFSRQQTVAPVVVDLRGYLTKLRDMLQSSLRGDIAITLDAAAGLWPVKVDLGELELAILNLGVNARDAMPDGGTLTLSARNTSLGGDGGDAPKGDFVAISVRDTGVGIPSDVLAKVFEPFFTTKEVGKGTGLGLSQVYGFAKQAGGAATIASELGRGTEIILYLPRSREPVTADEDQLALINVRGEGVILLVEDNGEIAEVTKANLEELGYRVLLAPDASAALDVIESDRTIDLVFSDIVMPGTMSGLDLGRALRRIRPGLPVVLTTGYSSALQSAAPEGFTLLTKPYDLASLHTTIDEVLRQRGAKVMPLMLRQQD
ncbi:MAG TPA: ATP-binding protein [Microvirga sp.]|jgi:two-component system NtrC family sensor kinase|nr:ATP-binding protein [Microvirga sp.]